VRERDVKMVRHDKEKLLAKENLQLGIEIQQVRTKKTLFEVELGEKGEYRKERKKVTKNDFKFYKKKKKLETLSLLQLVAC
jgi:CRISPR/Cas system-associated protein Cas5 (RAMP superfamily)